MSNTAIFCILFFIFVVLPLGTMFAISLCRSASLADEAAEHEMRHLKHNL